MAKKVLVVDDDRLNVTLIQFALKEQSYLVQSAEDGLKGLEAVKSFMPDLIVLDVQMPNMSGFEFLNELKSIPGASHIPVIMLTANENMQDIFRGEGAIDYFVKPVNTPKLLAKIRACLGS
ncbi:MAG: response regulator [Candidatus Omnitrophica bacterium]|nr:response regulator [Candidatus Omnitrophota bacterium]